MSQFGERLKAAFAGAKNKEIAQIMGVSESAVSNYIAGRVPDADTLITIKKLTNCDLDWLLTGDESKSAGVGISSKLLLMKLRTIAAEQAPEIFGHVEIAGPNVEGKTLDILIEFLINRAMQKYNILDANEFLMNTQDVKRAERFTFVANQPATLEDRIGEIVEKKISGNSVSSVAQDEGFRVMIRELVQEEIKRSTKRPFLDIDFGQADEQEEDAPIRRVA